MLLQKLLLLVVCFSLSPRTEAQWNLPMLKTDLNKIKQAEQNRKPRTAIRLIDEALQKLDMSDQPGLSMRLRLKKALFTAQLAGDKPAEKLAALNKELSEIKPQYHGVYDGIRAVWHTQYYQSNRWRIEQRSHYPAEDSTLLEWDLKTLYERTAKLWEKATADAVVESSPLGDYRAILNDFNTPKEYCPTLKTLYLYQAYEFHKSMARQLPQPENVLALDPEHPALGNTRTFLKATIPNESQDPNARALQYLQRLTADAHRREAYSALAWLAYERLEFVASVNQSEAIQKVIESRQAEFSKHYSSVPEQSLFELEIAKRENAKGAYSEALQRCRRLAKRWPQASATVRCKNLAERIVTPTLDLQMESSVNSANPNLHLSYRNLNKVHVRIYSAQWKDVLKEKWPSPGSSLNDDELQQLRLSTSDVSFEKNLEPTPNFQFKRNTVQLPNLPHGFYRILVSTQSSFAPEGENILKHTSFFVSEAMLLIRNRGARIEGQVLATHRGAPLEGAKVHAYSHDKNGYYQKTQSVPTDALGEFQLQKQGQRRRNILIFMESSQGKAVWHRHLGFGHERGDSGLRQQTRLYTDRSIYRPGQTVRVSGVCLQTDRSRDEYSTYPCDAVELTLRDANHKVVTEELFQAGEDGTFQAEFQLPSDRMSGRWRLSTKSPSGRTYIQVEEYKRPSFEVVLDGSEKPFRAGETANALGRAIAYSGAPMSHLKVRYRVTREAHFPFFRGRWGGFHPAAASAAREISRGTVYTDEKGGFSIPFEALADEQIHPNLKPVFHYRVRAEVLDNSGESRSSSMNLKAGYEALKPVFKLRETADVGKQSFAVRIEDFNARLRSGEARLKIHSLKGPSKPRRRNSSPIWDWEKKEFLRRGTRPKDSADYSQWPNHETLLDLKKYLDDGLGQFETALDEGAYRAQVYVTDASGNTAVTTREFLVADAQDTRPLPFPVPAHFQIDATKLHVGDTLQATLASGYQEAGDLFLSIVHRGNIVHRTHARQGRLQIEFPISKEHRGGLTVLAHLVRDNQFYSFEKAVEVPFRMMHLHPRLVSFRDTLEPNARESWKVQILDADQRPVANARVLASLYDASLDQFKPHSFAGFSSILRQQGKEGNYQSDLRLKNLHTWHSGSPHFAGASSLRWPDFSDEVTGSFPRLMTPRRRHHGRLMMRKSVGGMADSMQAVASFSAGAAPTARAELAETEPEEPKDSRDESNTNNNQMPEVAPRTNLQETAFFLSGLKADSEGHVDLNFSMPEALTRWKLLLLSYDPSARSGVLTTTVITQKELMAEPNFPRFFSQGDTIDVPVKLSNLSDQPMEVEVRLKIERARDKKRLNSEYQLDSSHQVYLEANSSTGVQFPIRVPRDSTEPVRLVVVARSQSHADGQANLIPVLPSRMLVRESLPLSIRGQTRKNLQFQKLLYSDSSPTLSHEKLVLQMASNPTWYAVQALPWLDQTAMETSDQAFSRLYTNALGKKLVEDHPEIEPVLRQWKGTEALKSNLQKSQDLKDVLLKETPWVLEAEDESAAKAQVAAFMDTTRLQNSLQTATERLGDLQLDNGAWPWCPGGQPSRFTTLMITGGLGRLREFGALSDVSLALKALSWLDTQLREDYERLRPSTLDENHFTASQAYMLYARSLFLQDQPIATENREAWSFWVNQAREFAIQVSSRQAEAYAALAMLNMGEPETARRTYESLRERSVTSDEFGRYWRDQEYHSSWHRAPIEAHAYMIELFNRMGASKQDIADLRVWLLKQKQTQNWGSRRATSEAVFALLSGSSSLLNANQPVEVYLGGERQNPSTIEAGTGFYEVRIPSHRVSADMGDIVMQKSTDGVAWGGLHWQYFEEVERITTHGSEKLSLQRQHYVQTQTPSGPELQKLQRHKANVGDTIVTRLVLKTDRDLEYVHLKDPRAATLEPTETLSRHTYKDGLLYYEVTRDTATHYYIEYLPKGTYVLQTSSKVFQSGEAIARPALIECHYAPEFKAHTPGIRIQTQPSR